jgi:5-methylthioadenosine/S-adenosylhomocysteine deaminase
VKAALDSGTKTNFSRSITCFDDADLWALRGATEAKAAYEQYHNAADGRIKIDLSLHAEYTSTPKVARQLGEYAREIGANVHIHLSESQTEHEDCKKRHGVTPAVYFNRQELFETPTTAAHCVWIEEEDMEILKAKGVTVATNPVSNLKLASGVCNVPGLLKKGINVAIGTDGVASNNSLNFIEELKFFATLAKMRSSDPSAVTPEDTIYAATIAGAKAQGRNNCGRLSVGNRADLILLDISGPNMHPSHSLLNNLVYSASGSDVVMTMVDGKILYKDGEYTTIDLEKTIYEVNRAVGNILRAP